MSFFFSWKRHAALIYARKLLIQWFNRRSFHGSQCAAMLRTSSAKPYSYFALLSLLSIYRKEHWSKSWWTCIASVSWRTVPLLWALDREINHNEQNVFCWIRLDPKWHGSMRYHGDNLRRTSPGSFFLPVSTMWSHPLSHPLCLGLSRFFIVLSFLSALSD